jgi:putative DNA primase/helicase
MSAVDSFRAAMLRTGLGYAGAIEADGKLRRFRAEGDKSKNSWYVLFAGPPMAGAFGCWKRGINEEWHDRNGQLSQAERQRARQCLQEAKSERERVERERRKRAGEVAARILKRAKPLFASHPYFTAKRVKAHGEAREYRGAIALPLRDTKGELHSLQFIGADGEKRFLTGGRVQGCFFTLGDKADGPLVICEGYATGASIHQATGNAVICAMNCGNMLAVSKAAREFWPQREIIIAADNDQWTEAPRKNPGLTDATAAAKAIRARLTVPQFKDAATQPTDFNDLAALEGLAAVKQQIDDATVPAETDADTYTRLAALPPAEYDRCREQEANSLGVRVSTLDTEVEKLRGGTVGHLQGCAVEIPEIEPWPEPVEGAETLDAVAAAIARYVALPPGAADAMALWAMHTHCFQAFDMTPRLNIRSPEKGCGKTTLSDVIALFVPRSIQTENQSPAVLFRLIEKYKPVVLADEYDSWLPDNEELRGLLNAGHRRGGKALRCEGDNHEVRAFNVFAPVVLCGIGTLPGTLHDRSIGIVLTRAKPGEVAARFSSRHVAIEKELCRKLARWAADNFKGIEACDPQLPDGAHNRLADNWRPLFAIAAIAGGDWPRRAAAAFTALASRADMDAQGTGSLLLSDIAAVFQETGADKLPSAMLAEKLANIEGRPWADFGRASKPITPNQLAKLLRPFKVSPKAMRIGDDIQRGYLLADFKDVFSRFLPVTPTPKCNTVTNVVTTVTYENSKPKQASGLLHSDATALGLENQQVTPECCGVAVANSVTEKDDALLL